MILQARRREGLNQRSWVAALPYSLTVRPSSSSAALNFLLELMRAFKRTDAHVKFTKELSLVKKHFNDAISRRCVKQTANVFRSTGSNAIDVPAPRADALKYAGVAIRSPKRNT